MATYVYQKIYPTDEIKKDLLNIGIDATTVLYENEKITITTTTDLTTEQLEQLDAYMKLLGFERI